jgi:hypothetical protein
MERKVRLQAENGKATWCTPVGPPDTVDDERKRLEASRADDLIFGVQPEHLT